MNYTQLSTALQDWCQSNETTFVAHIPDFVKQAETRLYQTLRSPDENATYASVTISPGTNTFHVPVGVISVNALYVTAASDLTNTLNPLYQKEQSWIYEAYPSTSTQGQPRYYALTSASVDGSENQTQNFLVGPYADVTYNVTLLYFGQPTSIVTNNTSWYGTFATDALLYCSLVNAYGYLKGEADMLQWYESKAQDAIARVQRVVEGTQKQDTFRNNPIRRPIQ